MERQAISDKAWETMQPLVPKSGAWNDNSTFINAIVYQAKTGVPWRDLPERYGNWNTVFVRFNRWSKSGRWKAVFELVADPDPIAVAIDSTTIRANQVAAGAKKKRQSRLNSDDHAAD